MIEMQLIVLSGYLVVVLFIAVCIYDWSFYSVLNMWGDRCVDMGRKKPLAEEAAAN
jgi:hypothetical protein